MTMNFSKRHGLRRNPANRDTYEEAPEPLRVLLVTLMEDSWGLVKTYERLCGVVGTFADPGIWSDRYARPYVESMVERLQWFEVFDLLEQVVEATDDAEAQGRVNDRLAVCGLGYAMDRGEIDLLDAEARALGITGVEHETENLLHGRFGPVREQYQKAIAALHGRPADLEKAVSESLNALEAVARVITGEKDFGKAIDAALANRIGVGGLAASLKALYGWASQVPGARHGRHAEPDLTFADARYAVRTAGLAIAYLMEVPEDALADAGGDGTDVT